MTNHRILRTGLPLAVAFLLLGVPATAQDTSAMTSPPWGYDGARMTFGDEDEGVLQVQYKGQFRMNVRDFGSGEDGDDTTMNFGFRRNRIAIMGAWGETVSLYVQSEFTEDLNVDTLGVADFGGGSSFQLLDAAVRFNFDPALKLHVGKFKYNLSRENLEACEDPLTLDRSLFIRAPFVGTRSLGLALWGNLFDDRFQYRAEVMEGRGAVSGVTAPSSSLRYGARGHVSLLEPEAGYGYKGTYLGERKVLTLGGAVQFEPDVTYVDTDTRLGQEDYLGWTVDGYLEYPMQDAGTITASAAYEKVDLGDAYRGANPDGGATGIFGEKNGWYAKGGYLLPGMPLQLFGRYEKWRFACLSNVFDQMVDWYGFGANYYVWGQNLKITAEWSKTDFDVEGTFADVGGSSRTTRDFSTFVAQMQFIF